MEEDEVNRSRSSVDTHPSRSTFDGDPSSSSSSNTQIREEEGEGGGQQQGPREDDHQGWHSGAFHGAHMTFSNLVVPSTSLRQDVCSCLVVVLTFCFFASMTLILGFYGSENLALGPNCSRLVQVNSFFVQSIKAREIDRSTYGLILYGVYESPNPDVEITWSEMHDVFVQSNYHKEWRYFLNEGSKVDISYSVKSPSFALLSLVIAQGKESLVEWIKDPSYPNTTLSWNIINGNGVIQQDIVMSKVYYIAVGNLNSEEVKVDLNFTIKAAVYDTTQAYYNCSLSLQECSLKLPLLIKSAAILTSPGPEQGMNDYEWYVKLSYGPRWFTYIVGSGMMTILMILAFRICVMFQLVRGNEARSQVGEMRTERAPLLSPKDDDISSWGSSYDSISHDEEELDKFLAVAYPDGKLPKDGESINNRQRLCVICFDAPRDCFFLPCGHCALCFACGTRTVEEGGTCPVCSRTMKKVRKIFTV